MLDLILYVTVIDLVTLRWLGRAPALLCTPECRISGDWKWMDVIELDVLSTRSCSENYPALVKGLIFIYLFIFY